MKSCKTLFSVLLVACEIFFSQAVYSYPGAEILGTDSSNPPFDFSVSATLSGFLLTSDRRLVLSYSESLKLVDLGKYELEGTQPVAPSSTDGTDGVIAAIAYDSSVNDIIASQEDGDLLIYDLDKLADKPASVTLLETSKLGPIAVDTDARLAYVADNTAKTIIVFDLNSRAVSSTITLTAPNQTSFTLTDAVFVSSTGESYFTTSTGGVFYITSRGTTATRIDVDPTGTKNLAAISAFPNGSALYVVDSSTPAVARINTSSHAVVKSDIDISANPTPKDVVVTDVTDPGATYAFVAGAATPAGGVSVINTGDDSVFDLGSDATKNFEPLPVSASPVLLAASSSTDGYVYMGFSTGKLGILSANPFVQITDKTFSDGSSVLKIGQSLTMKFKSDQAGTYTIRAGGTVTGNGTDLKDVNGNSSGSCEANTEASVTINYDDNSSAFTEGTNDVWVFVAKSPNTGRRATTVTVDTPPPNVTIQSAGFGNDRIYVNFDRIDVSDIANYYVYLDTDADAVLTKSETAVTVAQPSAGSTATAEISGLSNGVTYYIAMQAVDSGGNLSPSRTNQFADGTVAFGMPEETVGPAGLLGEKGCVLVPMAKVGWNWALAVIGSVCVLLFIRTHFKTYLLRDKFLRVRQHRRGEPPPPAFGGVPHPSLTRRNYLSQGFEMSSRKISLKRAVWFFFLAAVLFSSADLSAQEKGVKEKSITAVDVVHRKSPQMWSVEVKTGFWIPSSAVLDLYFDKCCNLITRIEGGLLLHKRYGIEGSVGFFYKTASARGVGSGAASQDSFNFILIPVETNFTWRADYFTWRYLVPYVKTGFDYVYFREGDRGSSTQDFKFGLHGGGGVGINIGEMGDIANSLDSDFAINDLFLTLDARAQWINNFGGGGLNLSGGVYSIGLLFEF